MTQLVVTISDKAMLPRLRTAIRQLQGVVEVKSVRQENASVPLRKPGKLRQELIERLQSLSNLFNLIKTMQNKKTSKNTKKHEIAFCILLKN